MNRPNLTIDLSGNFDIHESDSKKLIDIRGSKEIALLALLITETKQCRRSKDWLKSKLWGDRGEKQAQDSLRKAAANIRDALGPVHRDALCSDRSHLWLEGVTLADNSRHQQGEFFADASTKLGIGFEEWLNGERAKWDREEAPTLPRRGKPGVVIAAPRILPESPTVEIFATQLCDKIIANFHAYGLVDVFDLRDLNSDQTGRLTGDPVFSPEAVIQIGLYHPGSEIQISIHAVEARTKRVIWSAVHVVETPRVPVISVDQIVDRANQTVDALHNLLLSENSQSAPQLSGNAAMDFANFHSICSVSPHGQHTARANVLQQLQHSPSAMRHAMVAYTFANEVGECEGDLDAAKLEEARYHCVRAIELGPTDGLALSLAGHVLGFVIGDLEQATELLTRAQRLAPDLPGVWDLSAMNSLYRGDAEAGYGFSLIAERLGRFSPYKPLFDSSRAIAATLTGRHDTAILAGTGLLVRQPGFLAVKRHLFSSYAITDRTEEARKCLSEVRARDSGFTRVGIRTAGYPLPSPQSIEAIDVAFGLVDP